LEYLLEELILQKESLSTQLWQVQLVCLINHQFVEGDIRNSIFDALGAVAALIITKIISGKFSLLYSMNGLLAGLVGICSGCAVFDPWASVVTGVASALVYLGASKLLIMLKVRLKKKKKKK